MARTGREDPGHGYVTYRSPAEMYADAGNDVQMLVDLGLPWKARTYLLLGGKLSFMNLKGSLFVEVHPPKWLRRKKWMIGFLNHLVHEKIEA